MLPELTDSLQQQYQLPPPFSINMKRSLESVNERLLAAIQRRPPNIIAPSSPPRLVAVSKLKPISNIIEAYKYGQRHFGENYIQELVEKSNSDDIIRECPDIKFHFIGHLQSNKVNKLLKVRNLFVMETIDSVKLADLVDRAIDRNNSGKQGNSSGDDGESQQIGFQKTSNDSIQQLRVMIQVNTSGEEQKNGIQPEEAPKLANHILRNCKWLHLAGIMTIGKLDGWNDPGPNKDFVRLYELRNTISAQLSLDPQSLELSMGMSGDFEEAITMGSSNVRVGTLIFGQR